MLESKVKNLTEMGHLLFNSVRLKILPSDILLQKLMWNNDTNSIKKNQIYSINMIFFLTNRALATKHAQIF